MSRNLPLSLNFNPNFHPCGHYGGKDEMGVEWSRIKVERGGEGRSLGMDEVLEEREVVERLETSST